MAVAGAALLPTWPAQAAAAAGASSESRFTFRMHGQPNEAYAIQASPDLVHWTATTTNQADAAGVILFTDAQAASFTQRFYRGVRLSAAAGRLTPILS